VTELLRHSTAEFEALRDGAAERLEVAPGAIEKDYWATEVLRSACAHDLGVDSVVFKGGTSLSKAYRIIERFSEDVDLLVVTGLGGNALKRLLRSIADRVTADLDVGYERETEGRGFLNARFAYPAATDAAFLTSGVLLEMGSRGGPAPNETRTVRSLMSEAAEQLDPSALADYADLTAFDVTVLAPERTLAEKMAFLHHHSTTGDVDALRRGARHLYDVTMLLRSERVRQGLARGEIAALMEDVDARSQAAGWPFTPRPEAGFAASPAFSPTVAIIEAFETGFVQLGELVWGELPGVADVLDEIRSSSELL